MEGERLGRRRRTYVAARAGITASAAGAFGAGAFTHLSFVDVLFEDMCLILAFFRLISR